MTDCPYCGSRAVLFESSAQFYGGRNFGPVWVCEPCDAWVGCHPGTTNPLGTPANATTRKLKVRAHAAFDPLWKAKIERDKVSKKKARSAAYAWLSRELGIPGELCHMGMMRDEDLERVIALCEPYAARLRGRRAS